MTYLADRNIAPPGQRGGRDIKRNIAKLPLMEHGRGGGSRSNGNVFDPEPPPRLRRFGCCALSSYWRSHPSWPRRGDGPHTFFHKADACLEHHLVIRFHGEDVPRPRQMHQPNPRIVSRDRKYLFQRHGRFAISDEHHYGKIAEPADVLRGLSPQFDDFSSPVQRNLQIAVQLVVEKVVGCTTYPCSAGCERNGQDECRSFVRSLLRRPEPGGSGHQASDRGIGEARDGTQALAPSDNPTRKTRLHSRESSS